MIITLNVLQTNGIGNPDIPLNVDASGIDIGGTVNGAPATSLAATVADFGSVDITITQTGYHPYSITIDNVYDVDNTIDVVMVPITLLGDPEYNLVTPAFFVFQDPNSFTVDTYIASSYAGDISWYVENTLYSTGTRAKIPFIAPGDYQIKVVTENDGWLRVFGNTIIGNSTYGLKGELIPYLALDLTNNITVVEYRPDFSLSFSGAGSPVLTDDLSCYAKNETITVTPFWLVTKPGAVLSDYTITYAITDPSGNPVTLATSTFNLLAGFAAATITFDLTEVGQYVISATITEVSSGTTFPITYNIDTCNFVNIQYKECNTFTVANRNSTIPFDYSISQHNVVGVLTSGTLAGGESFDITFTNPGLFIMTVDYFDLDSNPVQEQYIITNHCEIENCVSDYITNVLCGGGDACSPCPPDNELNQMLLLNYTYFMKLNKEYSLNNFYNGLSAEKLDELTTIEQILNKLTVFCNRRGCVDQSFSEGVKAGQQVYTWKTPGTCNCSSTNTVSKSGYCGSCGGSVNTGCSSCN